MFYVTAAGSEPVRDWLRDMPPEDRQAIGFDLMRAQFAWPIGMPLCRPMGDGLFEIRTHLPSKKVARVMLVFHLGALYALHGFIKKMEKTLAEAMKMARRRKLEVENG